MRDLRAELQSWQEDAPVEWTPKEGDIIVGFVRSTPSTDPNACSGAAFFVCEERAMTPVRVNLDSAQLAVLIELHNPTENERVGIKYVGRDQDGQKRYQMIVDRAAADRDEAPEAPLSRPSDTGARRDDDSAAATPEEKDYIERMLSAGLPASEAEPAQDSAEQDHLQGLIRRQEEELARQTRALERLEAMICSPPPDSRPADDSESDDAPAVPPPPPERIPCRVSPARPKRRWLRTAMLWLAVLAMLAAGAAYIVFANALLSRPP